MPKSGPPQLVGVGSLMNASTATFRVFKLKTTDNDDNAAAQSAGSVRMRTAE